MIIDSHIHLGYLTGMYSYDVTLQTLLEHMDQLGISRAINSSCYNLTYGDIPQGYPKDIEAYQLSGGRIMSYYVYNPHDGENCLTLMDQFADRNIFKGIKIHPSFHGVFADDERYRPVYEYARAKNLVLISHTWTDSLTNPVQKFSVPPRFARYAREFKDVPLILAHSGGRYEGICQAIELGRECPNILFDVAGDIYIDGFVETLVRQVGADRVLYGSDYPMMDPRIMLGAVLGAKIPLADQEKILYGNALRIFNLEA